MNIDEINSLIDDIHWDRSDEVRQVAMDCLIHIDDDYISMLVMPRDKPYWDCAAEILKGIGYPRVNKVLPRILVWLQDINWPGSREAADFLLNIGRPVIPYVREVLFGSDTQWQYWILECLVSNWSIDMIADIKSELLMLARGWDTEGTSILATKILAIHKLYDREKLSQIYEYKKSICNDLLYELNEIEKYIKEN